MRVWQWVATIKREEEVAEASVSLLYVGGGWRVTENTRTDASRNAAGQHKYTYKCHTHMHEGITVTHSQAPGQQPQPDPTSAPSPMFCFLVCWATRLATLTTSCTNQKMQPCSTVLLASIHGVMPYTCTSSCTTA